MAKLQKPLLQGIQLMFFDTDGRIHRLAVDCFDAEKNIAAIVIS